jgi:hypothetical protein
VVNCDKQACLFDYSLALNVPIITLDHARANKKRRRTRGTTPSRLQPSDDAGLL